MIESPGAQINKSLVRSRTTAEKKPWQCASKIEWTKTTNSQNSCRAMRHMYPLINTDPQHVDATGDPIEVIGVWHTWAHKRADPE